MREGNRRRPVGRSAFALPLLLALGLAGPARAAPVNDNYLSPLRLNDPGTPLNKVDTLDDHRDLTGATVQSDIFNPPLFGVPETTPGPPEPTTCKGVGYGATIWYDFDPDVNGKVRIRTSGLDTVTSLVPFDGTTGLPNFAARRCLVNVQGKAPELDAHVTAGQPYAVQIGGLGGAVGPLEFQFDFVAENRLVVGATLHAQALSTGVRVRRLAVRASHGARIEVRCSRGCATQAASARTVSFPRLTGTRLAAGAKIEIFVTARNAVGAYIEYRIGRGSFTKLSHCLAPGTHKRIACP